MTSIRKTAFILIFSIMFPYDLFAVTFTINSCPATTDLFDHMSEQVDNRISGVTANDASKKLFTSRGNLTSPWIRSSTVWTENVSPIDFSGMSPWNSRGGYTRAGTLVTPRHIVLANHYLLSVGDTVLFVDENDAVVTRTVTHVQRVLSTDISVAKLSSDVPENITHYPIIDTATLNAYMDDGYDMSVSNLPIVVFDQEDKAIIKNISKNFVNIESITHTASSTLQRFDFDETLIGGDSGNPGFVLIGDKPALLLTHYSDQYGPSYPYYRQYIQDVINNMGGEHQLSTINLSCFNAPIVLQNNTTLNVVENAATSTVIGTIGIEYNIENNTPYFSFLSGNDNGALAISSSTGQITVASSSLITTTNFPRSVEVAVEENGPGGRMSKETYYINLNSYPYFQVNDYSFNVTEHSSVSTAVGSVRAYDFQSDTLKYLIVSGNDSGIFSISSSTGAITVASSTILDHESDTAHTLVIRAQEANTVSELYKDINVNISVSDINYTFSSPSYTFQTYELAENNTVVGSVNATIADSLNISSVYYEIIAGNTNSIFSISSSTGQITINNNEYLDGNDIYNLSIGVKDGPSGDVLNSVSVIINVSKDDRPNLYFEQQAQSLVVYSVQEGSSVNMTFQLSGPYTKTIVANLVKNIGSAVLNTDYTLSTDTLTFLPGETSKTVSFSALTDSVEEGNESILLDILDNTRVSYGPRQNATINISNKAATVASSGGGGGGGSSFSIVAVSTSTNILANSNLEQNLNQSNNVVKNNIAFIKPLTLNSIAEDVKNLQKFLNSQGFIVATTGPGSVGNETTKFGPATQQALARFQSANNIKPAIGFLGPVTINFIKNKYQPQLDQTILTTGSPIANTNLKKDFNMNLESGMINEYVKNLQKFLNSQGFIVATTGPGSVGNETTKFGPATQQALARFQSANNIKPAIGFLGSKTRDVVNNIINSI